MNVSGYGANQPPVNITSYVVKQSIHNENDVALAIIIFLIRAIIALLPVVVLIILPLGLLVRFVQKRVRRRLAKQSREKLESEG